jgi:hypothetical protein
LLDFYYVPIYIYRWLLLDFKREFPFEESIRMFEVLSSHYLELNSDKARVETDKVIAKEFELDGQHLLITQSCAACECPCLLRTFKFIMKHFSLTSHTIALDVLLHQHVERRVLNICHAGVVPISECYDDQ